MKRAPIVACGLALCWVAPALADVVHLKNGRTLEGEVLEEARGLVHIRVPGGQMTIPANTVERIEQRLSPADEYALRARRIDTGDPDALDALALWASGRGLGEQALQLRAQARGIRLQRRVDALRGTRSPEAVLNVLAWARQEGCSEEVQRWLLHRALTLDPQHPGALAALARLDEPAPAVEAAAPREPEATPSLREELVEELRTQLSDQRQESQRLRERLDDLEEQQRRMRVIRRHRRGQGYGLGVILVPPGRPGCEPPLEEQPQPEPPRSAVPPGRVVGRPLANPPAVAR